MVAKSKVLGSRSHTTQQIESGSNSKLKHPRSGSHARPPRLGFASNMGAKPKAFESNNHVKPTVLEFANHVTQSNNKQRENNCAL